MRKEVHEIDIVSYVDPVQRDVREQSPDTQLLEVVILLLQQTAVCADSVNDP